MSARSISPMPHITNSFLIVIVIFIAAAFGPDIGTAFAMHDSNLDVNTWI
jgi:ABC-type uncharacterized transport system permease subunit